MKIRACTSLTLISLVAINFYVFGQITVPNQFHFPYGDPVIPFIGLFVAIAFPVEINNMDLFFSVNLEANYNLPSNQSNFTFPPIVSGRSSLFPLTRKSIYEALELKLEGHGYSGEKCLLRMICESAEIDLDSNGILSDLINLILRPSFSIKENITSIYQEAENYGREYKHCKKYSEECSFSIIKLITMSPD